MTDDVKAAVEWLRRLVRDGFSASGAHLLAHIDGEQARQDASVAAAREEQREACALWMQGPDPTMMDVANGETVRGTPLTSTPLADRIAELEAAFIDEHKAQSKAIEMLVKAEARVAELEAENDGATAAGRKIADRWVDEKDRADYATAALRLHGFRECDIAACNCGSWHAPPNLRAEKAEAERDALRARDVSDHPGGALLVAEVASLRAQVEAARALAKDVLAAMDGAKPK